MKRQGFTLVELMVALAVGAMLTTVAIPAFATMLRNSRLDGCARQLVNDIRSTRARALTTGWEYRIVGNGAKASGDRSNQYRIVARRTSATAWPDDAAAPFESDTQMARRWVKIGSNYPGVFLHAPSVSGQHFQLTFDSRGAAPEAATSFNPIVIRDARGKSRTVVVSPVGGTQVH